MPRTKKGKIPWKDILHRAGQEDGRLLYALRTCTRRDEGKAVVLTFNSEHWRAVAQSRRKELRRIVKDAIGDESMSIRLELAENPAS